MSRRSQILKLKAVQALRRALYLPVRAFPSRQVVRVIVKLDEPMRSYLLANSGVLDSN